MNFIVFRIPRIMTEYGTSGQRLLYGPCNGCGRINLNRQYVIGALYKGRLHGFQRHPTIEDNTLLWSIRTE